jgi:hydroxysqualene synthase
VSVDHYENFPVASWLCPRPLRPAIGAIYWFARTADDLADEGDATLAQRQQDLADYRADLLAIARGDAPSPRWPQVFGPLAPVLRQHALPIDLLLALLSAFEQDLTRSRYADRADLLDYCARSANPVGRLLLHLYGVGGEVALAESDAICSALQLINFWQDLSVDLPRGRLYIPQGDCAAAGVSPNVLLADATQRDTPAARALVLQQAAWARGLMQRGAPLVHRLPGRIGWELRLVVQGGLAVLGQVEALRGASLVQRPRLRPWHAPALLWRAACM